MGVKDVLEGRLIGAIVAFVGGLLGMDGAVMIEVFLDSGLKAAKLAGKGLDLFMECNVALDGEGLAGGK